jgi:DNA-binding NarL/FixJ family response regulator
MVAMTSSAHAGPGPATRFLLVDDHPDFRRQARALLEAEGIFVVGEASDGTSAVDEAATIRPDVVILDIGLPDIDGFEVARRLAALETPPLVILTSSREAATFGIRVASSGTAGFVRKDDLSAAAIGALVPLVVRSDAAGLGGGVAGLDSGAV